MSSLWLDRLGSAASFLAVLWLLLGRAALAQDAAVVRTGEIDDDLFLAAGSVDIQATVKGDAFVAGGWVEVKGDIADNLIAGGGLVDIAGQTAGDQILVGGVLDLAGQVGNNLVVTGGSIDVAATVGRKLFASAGRLRMGETAHVMGDVWLAGGTVDVAGVVEGQTVIAAGSAILRGQFKNNVEVRGLTLRLVEGTQIDGDLIYYGPEPPSIPDGVEVRGNVVHREEARDQSGSPSVPVYWLAMTAILGLLLDALLPGYVRAASARLTRRPIASFGLGAVILITTPVLVLLLFLTVLASAIGLAAIALYGVLLIIGPIISVFAATSLGLSRVLTGSPSALYRRLAFLGGIVILGLIAWLPYAGTPLLWLISVTGLGAASWQLYDGVATGWGPDRPQEPRRAADTAS